MNKIVELSENRRISIESKAIKSFWDEDKFELRINGSLEISSDSEYCKGSIIWHSEHDIQEIIKSPNWFEKLFKISWSGKAQYYEDKIIEQLKIVYSKNLKIEDLNKGLYISLDSVKQ